MTAPATPSDGAAEVVPGSFEPQQHFYPRVLNAQIHPLVSYMMGLNMERVIERYCHLHPMVDPVALREVLTYQPRYFVWAGADLFNVTTADGNRQMVIIETNSCPSGQKSMPPLNDQQEQGGYRPLVQRTIRPLLAGRRLPEGELAVLYDKNLMEASGYAAAMADEFDERVWLTPFYDGDGDHTVRFDDGVLSVRGQAGWRTIRAAFRYVTQRPWNRIPVRTKTAIINPILACLAGGRNKMVAAKAYDFFNARLAGTGLSIRVPETIRDVGKAEIPLWVARFGGHAVVKNPYSNAGQGVWTITSERELEQFMEIEQRYDRFIVQSLIGNYQWSSRGAAGRFFHVGTVPDKRRQIFVADLRVMISGGPDGWRPAAIYGRRSRVPLVANLDHEVASWDMLGTNLSEKNVDGTWGSDTNRLLLMDRRDFNQLGLGVDDLIEAFIQTVLAASAIDELARSLVTQKTKFRAKLFRSLNDDDALIQEILA
jgi:hypothetical protein